MNLKRMCYLLEVAVLSAVLTMMPFGLLKAFAGGNMSKTEVNAESTGKTNISVDNHQESSLTQVGPKGLLYKEYKVIVNSVKMRSGPGTNYSVTGTKYKNNIVYVRKISNGWAKIKENSKIHYLPASSIRKCQ